MKSERAWVGITCGFFLFIVVCLLLLLHMKGVFRATGNPEVGLLYFCCPVRPPAASPGRRVIQPLVGAILATPVCLLIMRIFLRLSVPSGNSWRGCLARYSGVRWVRCAFCLSAPGWIPDAIIRQRNESAQANRPRFSFAQASKSVQPPICFDRQNLRNGLNRFAYGLFGRSC